MGNATTIKFWNRKFYCRNILLSLRRLLKKLGVAASIFQLDLHWMWTQGWHLATWLRRWNYISKLSWNDLLEDRNLLKFRNQEKGVLAKGVSVESSVTPKETKNIQGYWAQQYIWHSERHSQEKRTFCKNPLCLVADKLRSLDSSYPFFLSDTSIWGQSTQMLQMLWSQGLNKAFKNSKCCNR